MYQYRSATSLYLLSILSQAFNVIVERGINAPGYGKEVLDRVNSTDKGFIFHWVYTVQLPDSQMFYEQMEIHTSKNSNDLSLA